MCVCVCVSDLLRNRGTTLLSSGKTPLLGHHLYLSDAAHVQDLLTDGGLAHPQRAVEGQVAFPSSRNNIPSPQIPFSNAALTLLPLRSEVYFTSLGSELTYGYFSHRMWQK